MKNTNNVECPKCGYAFDVSEILLNRIKEDVHKEYLQKYSEVEKLKKEISKQQSRIAEEIQKGINLKITSEKIQIEKKLRTQIESEKSEQIKSYEEQLKSQVEKTKELLKLKAEYQKIQRENYTLKEQYEAEMQTRLTKAVGEAKAKIKSDIEKTTGFKIAEKDLLIDQLKTEIQNAQRKIDQSSQQVQGEAAEIMIEKYLKEIFPGDEVSEYKKGERGADVILSVKTASNEIAGKIVYEIKRTKSWQKDWIDKFRNDLRKKNAVFGILVTDVFPKGVTKMMQIEEIWVCSFTEYQNLTLVLRQSVLLLFELKSLQKNKGTKMEMMHQFLTGPEFKSMVETIIQSFTVLKNDLNKEKGVMQGYWKSREIQLERVLTSTSEMYHTIKAIIGSKIQIVKQLEGPSDNNLLS